MMTSQDRRINQKVCFIAGTGHSGSTLLGVVLGSHSDCFYAGEADRVKYLKDESTPEITRVCKICGPNCSIWRDFVVETTPDLYEQISAKSHRPIIVDSTKYVGWLEKQINILKGTSSIPFLIFLQRDGRAVVNSYSRKYPAKDIEQIIGNWRRQIRQTWDLFDRFEGQKSIVRYEEFATEPESVVRVLCELLEIPYQHDMLNYYQHKHHPLGGNNGTAFLIAKGHSNGQTEPYVHLANHNRYYANHPLEIRLDLRWKKELDPSHAQLFEELAGQINADLGWE